MKQKMEAVIKRDQKGGTLETVPVPDYGDNEVLATAICGSDLHRYHWSLVRGKLILKFF